MNAISIAVVADFNPANETLVATNEAIRHCATALRLNVAAEWIGTETVIEPETSRRLRKAGGIWIGPASPYKSMEGALAAIRLAREHHIPLLGTCGGFQHIILEFARNVLGIVDAEHEETKPGAARLFISRLACSLVGRSMTITLQPDSLIARAYGCTRVQEQYRCNFGVNPDYVDLLRSSALRIVGSDDEGVVRAVELASHPFFIGTLFLPQHSSTAASPHPLISAFLTAASRHAQK